MVRRCRFPGFGQTRWKRMMHIPVEPVSRHDHEYGSQFVYNLLYRTNRREERTASKLRMRTTHSIYSEILIYKLICNLQGIIYNIPNSIWTTTRFDSQPSWVQYRRNRAIELQNVKQMQEVASGWVWWHSCSSKISGLNKFLDCYRICRLILQWRFVDGSWVLPANRKSSTSIEDKFNKILLQDPWNWWIQAKNVVKILRGMRGF